jgi:hypothetical protein
VLWKLVNREQAAMHGFGDQRLGRAVGLISFKSLTNPLFVRELDAHQPLDGIRGRLLVDSLMADRAEQHEVPLGIPIAAWRLTSSPRAVWACRDDVRDFAESGGVITIPSLLD